MEFEAWLKRPEELDRKLYNLEEKIAILRSRAEKSTSVLSPTPGGNSCNDSRLEELVIKIADLEAEEKRTREELETSRVEMTLLFAELEDPRQIEILTLRYAHLQSVPEIAKATDISNSSVRNHCRKGINAARVIFQTRMGEMKSDACL